MEETSVYDEIATVSKTVDNEYVDLDHVRDTKENEYQNLYAGYIKTSTVYCIVAIIIIVATILTVSVGILVYFLTLKGFQAEETHLGDGIWTGPSTQNITSTTTTSDINECENNPCKNGAECVNGRNKYSCKCSEGWTSKNCDVEILCPKGWLKHTTSCYLFSDDIKKWDGARRACNNLDGYLVEIHDEAAGSVIRTRAQALRENFWIGLSDSDKEGEWVWRGSRTKVTSEMYTNWAPGQPDDGSKSEDCALIEASYSYKWNDDQCYNKHRYICWKKLS